MARTESEKRSEKVSFNIRKETANIDRAALSRLSQSIRRVPGTISMRRLLFTESFSFDKLD